MIAFSRTFCEIPYIAVGIPGVRYVGMSVPGGAVWGSGQDILYFV